MADPNPYVIQLEDFGARFDRAQARKLAKEEAAMKYYDQFAQVNGPFTPGMKDSMQELWKEIEGEFTLGNATPQGRRKIRQLYSQYSSLAADAINVSSRIGTDLALIEADPNNYSDVQELQDELKQAQLTKANVFNLDAFSKEVTKASDRRIYNIEGASLGEQANDLFEEFGDDALYPNGIRATKEELGELLNNSNFFDQEFSPNELVSLYATALGNEIERGIGGEQRIKRLINPPQNEDGSYMYPEDIKLRNKILNRLKNDFVNIWDRRLDDSTKAFKAQSDTDKSVAGFGIGPFSAQDFYYSADAPEGVDKAADNIYKRGEPVAYENVLSFPDIKLTDSTAGSEDQGLDDKIIVKGVTFDADGNKLYLVEKEVYGTTYLANERGLKTKIRTRTVFLPEDQVKGVIGAIDGLKDKDKKYYNNQLKVVEQRQKEYYESLKNELVEGFNNSPKMKEGGVIKQGPISRAFNAVKKIITRS
tara:strand:- start:2964 stop:4397 length:1434 start_codon:yes stop_codon:yes gene_type:complete